MKCNTIVFLTPLALAALAATSCSHQTAEQKEAQSMGAGMQRSGTMSQADYVKVRELGHQVAAGHTLSDADLDWDLAFLKRSGNGIARARALTVLSEISAPSDAQKAKISPVVTPYLSSPDALTRQSALRVQRHGGLL
jgi:hypothetical protein